MAESILITGIFLTFIGLAFSRRVFLRGVLTFNVLLSALLFIGISLSYLGYNIAGYRAFIEDRPVAVIECRKVKNELYDMVLNLAWLEPKDGRTVNGEEKFLLSGDQWAIDGSVIKGRGILSGVNLYEVKRLKSRFLNAHNPGESPQVSYNLSTRKDTLTDILSRVNFNFIKAFYFQGHYLDPSDKTKFYLSISGRGFVIREKQ